MIIVMKNGAQPEQVEVVRQHLKRAGMDVHTSVGRERTLLGVIGDVRGISTEAIESLPGVERALRILEPYKLAGRRLKTDPTVVEVGGVKIGGPEVVLMAGPCAVEGLEMLRATATAAREAGISVLRGGAFKPRTSPYSFQGLGREGLEFLARVRAEVGLPVVTEVMAPDQIELVADHADMLQIGARNMQNFNLLQEVGRSRKPVMLKRGMMSSVDEWLQAAEYVLAYGNTQVVLCERGIRTFETHTRNTLDISAIPTVKRLSHLPVIVDPSHGTGRRDLVIPMAMAAVAAGADGVMVEAHPNPEKALSDGAQSLDLAQLRELATQVGLVAEAVGRALHEPPRP
ncbi:MAG: 3-deoxy-7-phosphoheptulonate synthase [Firmicutes bacterium]|jgi:3-deoxy-7-phosphoheptulonate synthase|nr:3-deoxy-7-phosphoheptulonate synthase [Bacillota bacterium]